MSDENATPIEVSRVRRAAATLFNRVWELLDEAARTPELDAEMIRAAVGSKTLWELVGGPREACIGEWQIARVYAELGMGRFAAAHAEAAVGLAADGSLGSFLLASSHEGAARAAMVAGDADAFERHRAASESAGAQIVDADDRAVWKADFETLKAPARESS